MEDWQKAAIAGAGGAGAVLLGKFIWNWLTGKKEIYVPPRRGAEGIREALESLEGEPGKIELGRGVYDFDYELTISSAKHPQLEVEGTPGTRLQFHDCPGLTLLGASDFKFTDFRVRGTGDHYGMKIDGRPFDQRRPPGHNLFSNVDLRNFATGLWLKDCMGSHVGGKLEESRIDGLESAIVMQDASQWKFDSVALRGLGKGENGVEILNGVKSKTERITFNNCHVIDFDNLIYSESDEVDNFSWYGGCLEGGDVGIMLANEGRPFTLMYFFRGLVRGHPRYREGRPRTEHGQRDPRIRRVSGCRQD